MKKSSQSYDLNPENEWCISRPMSTTQACPIVPSPSPSQLHQIPLLKFIFCFVVLSGSRCFGGGLCQVFYSLCASFVLDF